MTEQKAKNIASSRCRLIRRMAAITYDAVIVIGLLLIAAAVVSPIGQGDAQAFRDPLFTFYLMAIWFAYLALCWIHGGMTVGMRAWQIKILTDSGEPLSWKVCLSRFTAALFSTAIFGIGLLWSIYDEEKRCWHDIISHSGLYHLPKT
ncbi:MAG: putative RDD family membrane protein YckC [Lysobacterales bacterium]